MWTELICLRIRFSVRSVVHKAAGPHQHSQCCCRAALEPMIIVLFLPKLLRFFKWGLLFDERRVRTTNGHYPCVGVT
jgi:hypothetical protein